MCDFYRAIDLMLVNSVSDSWGPIHQARAAAQRLSKFVNAAYSLQRTRERLLHVLRRHLPAERRATFDRLAANYELTRALDEFTVY